MDQPRILLLDIETFPDVVYTWGVYEQNAIEVKEHWFILSYSAKWLGGEHITKGYWQFRGNGDEGLVKSLWKLVDKCDYLVAHNGAQFDCKKINTRFLCHGLKPPSPYVLIDTKRHASRLAGFSSNKLDWLCSQLHLGRKVEHKGFSLWKGCVMGNKSDRRTMLTYNRKDVILLEKLYLLLRPWIKTNAGMFTDGTICNACRSKNLSSDGWRRNATLMYKRVICNDCGHRMRVPKAEPRNKPLVSI